MMRLFFSLLCFQLVVIFPEGVRASETSRLLESFSDVVLVGTITVAPEMISGSAPLPSSDPKPYWSDSIARIKVEKLLKGTYPDTPFPLISLRIPMVAAESDRPLLAEALAPFAKGKRRIFFLQDRRLRGELGSARLNDEQIFLVAFDPYFSALPYNEALELELSKKK